VFKRSGAVELPHELCVMQTLLWQLPGCVADPRRIQFPGIAGWRDWKMIAAFDYIAMED
jgi:hypothetical protein